jgi:hypothetical protein
VRVLNAYEDADPWCRRMVIEFDGPRMKEILAAFQHNNDPRCECDFRVIHATAEKINLRVNIFMRSSCNYHLDLWEHYMQSHPRPNYHLFPVNVTVMK